MLGDILLVLLGLVIGAVIGFLISRTVTNEQKHVMKRLYVFL